jgi:hypothetical protein
LVSAALVAVISQEPIATIVVTPLVELTVQMAVFEEA